MKKVIGLLFAGVLAIQSSGCCSILYGAPSEADKTGATRKKWRADCHLLGNLLFGGLIGFVIDLATGAHMEYYKDGSHLPDGDPRKLYAVHLSDSTVMILKNAQKPTPEALKKARRLPKGVTVVKTEWVMRKSGS